MSELKKVIVLGPESTGKSTLCTLLTQHYNTYWCQEYAREYLSHYGPGYEYEDLVAIAKGQLQLQEATVRKTEFERKSVVFIDTDMFVMKVWSEYVFNKCDSFILEQAAAQKADLYLLCYVDLPWEQDELREYPDLRSREELYEIYKDILINQSTKWIEIKGDYTTRLQTAIEVVDAII